MAAVALLAGCATVGPASTAVDVPLVATPQFDIAGRLSARRGNQGAAAHFTWRHRPDGDVLDVATPMGQTLARAEMFLNLVALLPVPLL